MSLNKQGPGKIDYCDYTWSPIHGYCQNKCDYCYMRPMWKRFPEQAKNELRYHYLEENFPQKKSVIFVGNTTDMFGDWVPAFQIQAVLNVVAENPKHTFLFLTKNPRRYREFDLPQKNCWYGTTEDGTDRTRNNIIWLSRVLSSRYKKWASFEPMINRVEPLKTRRVDWAVIGADSRKGADKPPSRWAADIVVSAINHDVPVWIKDNYEFPLIVKMRPF